MSMKRMDEAGVEWAAKSVIGSSQGPFGPMMQHWAKFLEVDVHFRHPGT